VVSLSAIFLSKFVMICQNGSRGSNRRPMDELTPVLAKHRQRLGKIMSVLRR
jgi:hypothetical protein